MLSWSRVISIGEATMLKPISNNTTIYARPNGIHYHLDRNCPILQSGDFERMGYIEIKQSEIKRRKLNPCVCAYLGGWERR